MKVSPQRIARYFLDKFVSILPISLANVLEWRIQRVLGKGIGYGSISHEIRTLRIFLGKISLTRPILLDVGANTGQYALEFLKWIPQGTIFSFEPGREAFLELALKSYNVPNWNVLNFGFGSKSETMKLYSESPGSASSSLFSDSVSPKGEISHTHQLVEIKRIDDYIRDVLDFVPDIVKIDVEGFEIACLEGIGTFLSKVKLVQFEFGPSHVISRNFFLDFWNFFQTNGFQIYRITEKKPILIEEYSLSLETFAVTNYLALNSRYFSS